MKSRLPAPRTLISLSAAALVLLAGVKAVTVLAHSSTADGRRTSVSRLDISIAKTFKSWGELKGASTLVVIGTAGSQQTESGANGFPWTTTSVNIDRVVQGQVRASQDVLVRQVGGVEGGGSAVADEFPLLKPGTRYLLFLTASPVQGEWYPVGAFQGVFILGPDQLLNPLNPGGTAGGIRVRKLPLEEAIHSIQSAPTVNVSP